MIFGALPNILFVITMKIIIMLIKCSFRLPQIMLIVEPSTRSNLFGIHVFLVHSWGHIKSHTIEIWVSK
jgi:hypothetical protein